jgi:hypothetical protein
MNKYIFQEFPSNSLLFGVHDYMQFWVFFYQAFVIEWCFTLFVLFGLPIRSYVLPLIPCDSAIELPPAPSFRKNFISIF